MTKAKTKPRDKQAAKPAPAPARAQSERPAPLKRAVYEAELLALQIELSKFQRWVEETGKQVCIVMEGRDAAGKDGSISRILAYMPPRRARMVALSKPTDREQASWYFARYAPHLPARGELSLFNRSWYNRAGVEPVMGFCDREQYECFMRDVVRFEEMLVDSGVVLLKYYLDITKDEQAKRLAERRQDPLKWWKISPIDVEAQARWESYSSHRDAMFRRTSHNEGVWRVVDSNDKKLARLNLIRDLLSGFDYRGRAKSLAAPHAAIVFPFEEEALADGRIAP